MFSKARWLAAALLAVAVQGHAAEPRVEAVAPDAIEALVDGNKGILVLSITSTDDKCRPCVAANAKFQALARQGTNAARYVQVAWQPWRDIPPAVRDFLNRHGLPQAVPIRLAFQDGKLADKVLGEPPDLPKPGPSPMTGRVEVLNPGEAPGNLAARKGTIVVMFSSFDTDCAFCMRANPVFETLATESGSATVRFARVMYRPWTSAGADPLGQEFRINGLPTFVTYRDGRPVRRHDGFAEAAELRRLLLDGLN